MLHGEGNRAACCVVGHPPGNPFGHLLGLERLSHRLRLLDGVQERDARLDDRRPLSELLGFGTGRSAENQRQHQPLGELGGGQRLLGLRLSTGELVRQSEQGRVVDAQSDDPIVGQPAVADGLGICAAVQLDTERRFVVHVSHNPAVPAAGGAGLPAIDPRRGSLVDAVNGRQPRVVVADAIQSVIRVGSVVTWPLISDALTWLKSSVGSSFNASRWCSSAGLETRPLLPPRPGSASAPPSARCPAVWSEHTDSDRIGWPAWIRYSRRSCATSAIDGHGTTAVSPASHSSSTIRSEMRVLPVPHGSTILPRARPLRLPPVVLSACARSVATLSESASSCMQDFERTAPGPASAAQWGQSPSVAEAAACASRSAVMLTTLMVLPDNATVRVAGALGGALPLVISQRSSHSSPAVANPKESSSSLPMGLPVPVSSSLRALHWIATSPSSDRRTPTASIPSSAADEPGNTASRSGQSAPSSRLPDPIPGYRAQLR